LKKSQACGLGVDESINQDVVKLVFFIIGRFKPHKKAVNAVLYELARLTLFYKHNESLTSCGFHILNQLMETKESSPNFKFASLNLLKSFENISESSLKLLSNHCTLLLEIICKEDEDDSLRILALQVLSKITSHENLTNVVETLKQLLLKNQRNKANQEFNKMIIENVFYLLQNKTSDLPMLRINESIKLLLIVDDEIKEKDLSSLINLIMNHESCQDETLRQVYSHF
jgi:hypothetical protein